jgi:RNA 2',3'-cyclic 3'-phosphodiesterase
MRLFTGIAIDQAVLNNLEQVLRELRSLAPLNWSPVENLHITSRFIGEWPEQKLGELKRALEEGRAPAAFPVAIGRFGYFPNPHHPRVLFAGVKAGPELADLARRIDEKLVPVGLPQEARPYTPHLTLAKIRNEPIRALREHIANMKNVDFGTFPVSEFHLYLSSPRSGGSEYKILATFPLGPHA